MTAAWKRLALAGCFALAVCQPGPAAAQDGASAARGGSRLDSIARLLAGLQPTHPDHASLAATSEWKSHSRAIQSAWAQVHDTQRASLIAWRKAELPAGCPVGHTLLYPFSGPDFLNAHWLFPDCDALVLFGLEKPGEVPDIEHMSRKEFASLLAGVRTFMINLFVRNYFVTGTMRKNFQGKELRGLVPVFMVGMALSDVEVISVADFQLDAGATTGGEASKGITIDFRIPGSPRPRRLTYLSVNATNASLADHPEFLDYLRKLGRTTTLIKSASYLLHARQFSLVRESLLEASGFIVQDDTGAPYDQLAKRGWQLRFYGRYDVPIPPFEWAYQPALAAAHERAKGPPLPFRFGYQVDSGVNRSNLMVAQRSAGRSTTGASPR